MGDWIYQLDIYTLQVSHNPRARPGGPNSPLTVNAWASALALGNQLLHPPKCEWMIWGRNHIARASELTLYVRETAIKCTTRFKYLGKIIVPVWDGDLLADITNLAMVVFRCKFGNMFGNNKQDILTRLIS